ncbi:MAG: UDP-glucose dehydrogenase family protein [Candidatus Dojkabacteria bacterium]
MKKTIAIIGTGYVGLTTAALLSNAGFTVYTVDINKEKIDTIKTGKSYFYEAGLNEFVKKGVELGTLLPTTSVEEAVPQADIVFSCVGTPDKPDGSSDLTQIYAAAESVVKHAKEGLIFVQKSTVPVGTGKAVREHMRSTRPDVSVHYISNPEFLAEGSAVYDTLHFDRLVVGGEDNEAVQEVVTVFHELTRFAKSIDASEYAEYAAFYNGKLFNDDPQIITTNLESAELIKVTANAFLALKISFANSIALLCDTSGADISQVMHGVGGDRRIGKSFLYAGLGWGGGCFPKDVSGLLAVGQSHGVQLPIMESAVEVNQGMPEYAVEKLAQEAGNLPEKTIAILGLSFKPGTSDVRRSQSIKLANMLAQIAKEVRAFDPQAMEEAREHTDEEVLFTGTLEECIEGADVVVLATEWKEFIEYDWTSVQDKLKGTILLDARNRLDKDAITAAGMRYVGIGR